MDMNYGYGYESKTHFRHLDFFLIETKQFDALASKISIQFFFL